MRAAAERAAVVKAAVAVTMPGGVPDPLALERELAELDALGLGSL